MRRILLAVSLFLVAACTTAPAATNPPTSGPTSAPPTSAPTDAPATAEPTAATTAAPTDAPTSAPTDQPTAAATAEPAPDATVAIGPNGHFVSQDGMTLYTFDNDEDGVSNCEGDCIATWPALTVSAAEELTTGEGLDPADFATITRTDGALQVTFQGRPLYFYADDLAPGDTNGDGLFDVWHVATGGAPVPPPGGGGIDY